MGPHQELPPLDRRGLLRSAGAVAAALVTGACTTVEDGSGVPRATGTTAAAATPADPTAAAAATPATPVTPAAASPEAVAVGTIDPVRFDALGTCRLTPASAEGPFPNREELPRADITEGRPGSPVQLGLRVVDADCTPVEGAAVTVWHTDHTGDYSSYADGGSGKDEGEGTTFLRGVQTSDADGIVVFRTIFPGWYGGRAVHIHVGVRTPDGGQLTTQLYFDEALTAQVLGEGVYAEFGQPDTTLAADGLAGDPAAEGTQLVAEPAELGGIAGTSALLNLALPRR